MASPFPRTLRSPFTSDSNRRESAHGRPSPTIAAKYSGCGPIPKPSSRRQRTSQGRYRFSFGVLAHLGLAPAYVLQTDTAKAQTLFRIFSRSGKDADLMRAQAGVPVLQRSSSEG